jgi:hypothetical protein
MEPNNQHAENIMSLFSQIPKEHKEFFTMQLIIEMSLEAGGNPVIATGIIECAKQELYKSLGQNPLGGTPTSYEELTN